MREDLYPLVELLESEHPQTAAILLFSLAPEDAGSILAELSAGLALELAERIITTGEVAPEVLENLFSRFESFEFKAARLEKEKNFLLLEATACAGYLRQREIISGLADLHGLAIDYPGIRTFEDILKLDAEEVWEPLGRLSRQDLTLALRIVTEEVREGILKILAPEIAAEIRSDLDWGGPVLMADVEAATERVLMVIKENI